MTLIDDYESVLDAVVLGEGGHMTRAGGTCAMEAVAWLAGEPHSDRPECASPILTVFVQCWNDALPDRRRSMTYRTLDDALSEVLPCGGGGEVHVCAPNPDSWRDGPHYWCELVPCDGCEDCEPGEEGE